MEYSCDQHGTAFQCYQWPTHGLTTIRGVLPVVHDKGALKHWYNQCGQANTYALIVRPPAHECTNKSSTNKITPLRLGIGPCKD